MQLAQTTATASPMPALAPIRATCDNRGKILLACDYPLARYALRALLERDGYEIAGEAASGPNTCRACGEFAPDVIVLDLEMPFVDGLALARETIRLTPRAGIVGLTVHSDPKRVLEALWSGVRGYVLKTSDPAQLLQAVRAVRRGGSYYCPEVSGGVEQAYSRVSQREKPQLTERERQVVTLIADGYSTKQVAGELGISVKTADSHRTKVMEKLDIHETASLVRFAIRQGLIQP